MTLRVATGWSLGVLLLASAVAHAWTGWPPLGEALAAARVAPETQGAVAAAWYFGSTAMAVFGTLLIALTRRLQAGDSLAPRLALPIGLGYLAFGVVAYVQREFNPHFLFFQALGLVILYFALSRR